MYTNLLDRFQGAFGGCAIAEMNSQTPALSQQLTQQGQAIQLNSAEEFSQSSEVPRIARAILLSLLYHDDPHVRVDVLSASPDGIKILSDVIALRLKGKLYDVEPQIALMQTIRESIAQQLPLQEVASVIRDYPAWSTLEKAIALAIYCWRSTPYHFSIAVGRSHQLVSLFPETLWITLVPSLTGLIMGVSVGHSNLPWILYPDADLLQQTANRLYGLWAGLPQVAIASSSFEEIVIAQSGQLRPRSFQHLSLNSDYE